MSKGAMNLQDSFLNQVRRENAEVKVLLVNGTALRGIVKGFDNFTVILNNRNGQHLIYKHAIAQLVSQRPTSPRHEGDEGHSEAADASSVESLADAPPAEARPHNRERRPEGRQGEGRHGEGRQGESRQGESRQNDGSGKQKQQKEGFNKIDLSGVKLGEEKVASK